MAKLDTSTISQEVTTADHCMPPLPQQYRDIYFSSAVTVKFVSLYFKLEENSPSLLMNVKAASELSVQNLVNAQSLSLASNRMVLFRDSALARASAILVLSIALKAISEETPIKVCKKKTSSYYCTPLK